MGLSKKAITEFMEIFKKTQGYEITYEEAEVQAESFLRLFAMASRKVVKPDSNTN